MDDRMTLQTMRQFECHEDLFGIVFDMLFSELCKIMMNGITFVGFRGSIAPTDLLEPPLIAGISYFCRSSKALTINMVTVFQQHCGVHFALRRRTEP